MAVDNFYNGVQGQTFDDVLKKLLGNQSGAAAYPLDTNAGGPLPPTIDEPKPVEATAKPPAVGRDLPSIDTLPEPVSYGGDVVQPQPKPGDTAEPGTMETMPKRAPGPAVGAPVDVMPKPAETSTGDMSGWMDQWRKDYPTVAGPAAPIDTTPGGPLPPTVNEEPTPVVPETPSFSPVTDLPPGTRGLAGEPTPAVVQGPAGPVTGDPRPAELPPTIDEPTPAVVQGPAGPVTGDPRPKETPTFPTPTDLPAGARGLAGGTENPGVSGTAPPNTMQPFDTSPGVKDAFIAALAAAYKDQTPENVSALDAAIKSAYQ